MIREEDLKNHMDSDAETPPGPTPEAAKKSQIEEELEKDNQLARALDVLKSWEILSQMKYMTE